MPSKLVFLCWAVLSFARALSAQTPADVARQYTSAHHAELIQQFTEFLAIPNVAGLRRNADFLVDALKKRSECDSPPHRFAASNVTAFLL